MVRERIQQYPWIFGGIIATLILSFPQTLLLFLFPKNYITEAYVSSIHLEISAYEPYFRHLLTLSPFILGYIAFFIIGLYVLQEIKDKAVWGLAGFIAVFLFLTWVLSFDTLSGESTLNIFLPALAFAVPYVVLYAVLSLITYYPLKLISKVGLIVLVLLLFGIQFWFAAKEVEARYEVWYLDQKIEHHDYASAETMLAICKELKNPKNCLYSLAAEEKNPKICDEIPNNNAIGSSREFCLGNVNDILNKPNEEIPTIY